MNRFNALLKVQLLGVFGINKVIHTKDKKEKRNAKWMGAVYLLVILAMLGYSIGFSLGYAYLGLAKQLPSMSLMISAMLTIVFTFLKSTGVLVGMKDYDMVMSLPVSTSEVVTSRLLMVYFLNFLVGCMILIPADITYGISQNSSISVWLMMAGGLVLAPLLPMMLAFALGALIMAAASRFKYKNAVVITLSIVAVIGVLAGSFLLTGGEDQFKEIGTLVADMVNRYYPPSALFSQALNNKSAVSYGIYAAISIGSAAVFITVLAAFYKKLNSAFSNHFTRSDYKVGELKTASPFMALYKREWKRFTSCSIYVLNTGIGEVMLIGLGISLLVINPETIVQTLEIPGALDMLGSYMPFIMAFIIGISSTTACSISMEGKNRWIMCSLPVKNKEVFNAKIALNLTLLIPAVLITGVLVCVGLKLGMMDAILTFIVPFAYALFISIIGLAVNLKFPKYDWNNEQQAVKGSAAVGITLGIGMGAVFIPFIISMLLPDYRTQILMAAVVVILLIAAYTYKKIGTFKLYI